MELYIIEDYKTIYPDLKGSELTEKLISDCLTEYGITKMQVRRTVKGKPYAEIFSEENDAGDMQRVHLSVSHSGRFFVCIIGEKPIGIDVQTERKTEFDKISARYFTEAERKYVEENGEKGFFRIWVRKEAYSKLTGDGIAELIRGVDVLERKDVEFTDFQLEDGVWCSYCTEI